MNRRLTTTDDPCRPTAAHRSAAPASSTLRELLRWAWRQLTSMRIALILLLLLALAAVPGSLVPQERVDALKASQWKDAHETLTPVYEKLGLFNVYGSPWFAAIYILLVISLVGCIVPRTFVYARAAARPAARGAAQPDPDARPRDVRHDGVAGRGARARPAQLLRRKRYRLAPTSPTARRVSAERGYLREVGNLLFHLAVLVVLVGFAIGTLFGYKGGVILVQGLAVQQQPRRSTTTSCPAACSTPTGWTRSASPSTTSTSTGCSSRDGARVRRRARATARRPATRRSPTTCGSTTRSTIGGTELFLIGHGYAPVVTVRDGNGDIAGVRAGAVPAAWARTCSRSA